MELSEFFGENPRVAVAFSGGADSSYLLYAAKKYGADVRAYYVRTPFQPRFEYEDAVAVCDMLSVRMTVIEYDILSEKNVRENPPDRCYYCKKAMLSRIKDYSAADGYDVVADGTNASDSAEDRPGMRALCELSVRSPLRECNLTKEKIRALSKEAGLITWNKPAYSCLATRVKTGEEITKEQLFKIESAEREMAKIGFSDFRVRVRNECALLQIKKSQFALAAELREEIIGRFSPYFDRVLLDMEAR